MADLPEIVSQLLRRTKENKVAWETTSDMGTFLATMASASVKILQNPDGQVFFSVIDQYGEVLESIDTYPEFDPSGLGSAPPVLEPSHFGALRELYALARRSALGTEKKLEELLRELEQTA